MSNPSRSLASGLDWRKVFQAVGLDEPHCSDLPQAMPCPLCETGALTVMSDHVLNGQWFHCSGCQFAGDLIEFSAKMLKFPIGGCINFLEFHQLFESKLCDDDLARYKTQQIDFRLRFRQFWEAAKHAPSQTATVGTNGRLVLRRFCLNDFVYQETWCERGGRLFGIAKRQVIEDLFAPMSYEEQDRLNRQGRSSRRRGGGPGKRRLFEGHDWDEILVIAHFDLPGRIIGFTFIGGDLDNPLIVFKRINLGCSVSRPRESGLGFLEALNGAPHPSFERTVFIFFDVELATLLHARHLRSFARPLPVVLARSTRDVRLLHLPPNMEECKLIFCGNLRETLPLAKAFNGNVSSYQVSEAEIRENLKHRDPVSFLWQFQKRAVSWFAALQRSMPLLPKPELEVLLGSLQLSPRESEMVQRGLNGAASERFAELTPHRIQCKQVPVGAFTVEETQDGWIARKEQVEQLICNRPIRIESIYQIDSVDVAYGISVRMDDSTAKFVATKADLKHDSLFDFVAWQLRNEFNEHLEFVPHKWGKLALSLALQFSKPEIIPHADRVGWNQARMRFQFPRFAILNSGQIDSTPMPKFDEDRDIPGENLVAPSCNRQAVAMLSRRTSETQFVWALSACVVNNLLAGNCTRESFGIVLDGDYSHETGVRTAKALGCSTVCTDERRSNSLLHFISARCGAQDFPSIIQFPSDGRPEITSAWIDEVNLRRAILPLPTPAAIAVGLHRGFVRLRSHDHPHPLGALVSSAGWLIPSYLEDLCGRKKQIRFWSGRNEIISVLHDMAEWLERCGGDPKAAFAGEKLLVFDSLSLAEAFVELVEWMQSPCDLWSDDGLKPKSSRSKVPLVIHEPSGNSDEGRLVQVRHMAINEILRQKRAPAIRLDDIRADLEAQSAWRGMSNHDEHGSMWSIDAEWWNRTTASARRKLRPASSQPRNVLNDGPVERENLDAACAVFDDSPQ